MESSFPAIPPTTLEEISHLIQVIKFLLNEYSYIKNQVKIQEKQGKYSYIHVNNKFCNYLFSKASLTEEQFRLV